MSNSRFPTNTESVDELMASYQSLMLIAEQQQKIIHELKNQNKLIRKCLFSGQPVTTDQQLREENKQLKTTLLALMNENHQLKSQCVSKNSSVTLPSGTLPPDEGALEPAASAAAANTHHTELAHISFFSQTIPTSAPKPSDLRCPTNI